MSEFIDYVEKAGIENIKFHLQNAETLAKESTLTLTLLLAGMGGAMAYAVKGFEQHTPTALSVAAAGLSIWLMLIAILLVVFCILSTDLQAPTNEPRNLYQTDFSLEVIREAELYNLDARIKNTAARNHRIAAWLDRCRLLAIGSPIVFALTSLAWEAHAPDLCVKASAEEPQVHLVVYATSQFLISLYELSNYIR